MVSQFDRLHSTQADLENFVQSVIGSLSIEGHENLSLQLPCIKLTTIGVPRLCLNEAATRNSLLLDLGIVQNTRVMLSHG